MSDRSSLAAGEAVALGSRMLGEIALGRGVFLHHDEEFALREITRGSEESTGMMQVRNCGLSLSLAPENLWRCRCHQHPPMVMQTLMQPPALQQH